MTTITAVTEEHLTRGEKLETKVRELIEAGNVRRIAIKNEEGRTLVELPLTVGVVGVLLAPAWAAVGAIAAVVSDCSIEVERAEPRSAAGESSPDEPEPDPRPRGAALLAGSSAEGCVDPEC
jgi:hypothetical protein